VKLEKIGLVEVEDKPLYSHGRMKEIRAAADLLLLAAYLYQTIIKGLHQCSPFLLPKISMHNQCAPFLGKYLKNKACFISISSS